MKIAVVGMWHLGTVTATCLASGGHEVVGIDEDAEVIAGLRQKRLPVAEPGLLELASQQIADNRLRFSSQFSEVAGSEIVWIAYDTPVDDQDRADTDFVISRVEALFPFLSEGSIVLISSQMPVGSTARLERKYRESGKHTTVSFAYSPENLRLGKAIEVFTRPDRVVAGGRTMRDRERIEQMLRPFTERVEWMSVESAEMTKHALNSFLAVSVAFINEVARICEKTGADALEVERGLKSDTRIGSRAYLHAGGAFAGGTLARDIEFLLEISARENVAANLLAGVRESNQIHKGWIQQRLPEALGGLAGKTVAVLGLTYKAGTDTLRRSISVETCRWLSAQGAHVKAFDPAVREIPAELGLAIELAATTEEALKKTDAVLIATEWPEFRDVSVEQTLGAMREAVVFDPGRFLEKSLGNDERIRYFAIGKPTENGLSGTYVSSN